jgi:hypothetical protein
MRWSDKGISHKDKETRGGAFTISEEGGWDVIQISKQAIEKLKGVHGGGKKI